MALQILCWSRAHHSFSHPKARYMVTLHIFTRPATFIFGRSLAYQALILDDVDFGNRQHVLATG
uniref:Uncharacterized protein n=1 Tax=Populus trichocarpa TaxID=3694 RepID=B9HWQ9_POPTR